MKYPNITVYEATQAIKLIKHLDISIVVSLECIGVQPIMVEL